MLFCEGQNTGEDFRDLSFNISTLFSFQPQMVTFDHTIWYKLGAPYKEITLCELYYGIQVVLALYLRFSEYERLTQSSKRFSDRLRGYLGEQSGY